MCISSIVMKVWKNLECSLCCNNEKLDRSCWTNLSFARRRRNTVLTNRMYDVCDICVCVLVSILKTRIIALSVPEVGYFHIGVLFFLSGHLFLSAPDGTSQLILDSSHFNQQPANVEGAAVSEKPSTQQVLYFFQTK